MATEFARMRQLFATTASWGSNDIILGEGEIGLELRTDGMVWGKVGDGVLTYSNLPYAIGNAVDLSTDQSIDGAKTFIDPILVQNVDDPLLTGQIYANDYFTSSQHALVVDSKEIDSNLLLIARDNVGGTHTLQLGLDGALYWDLTRIADSTGLSGSTWGAFDATAVITGGSGFSVAKPNLGEYDITFTEAAVDAASQSLVASPEGSSRLPYSVTAELVSVTQAKVWVWDNTLGAATDSAISFIRSYIPV